MQSETDQSGNRSLDLPGKSKEPMFEPLESLDLKTAADRVHEAYKNFILSKVNDHCIRMAVMQGEYSWHRHPRSDEAFITLEGLLYIDLENARTVALRPGEAFVIPAGVLHRTRSAVRTVNLCFEHINTYDDVEFAQ